MSLCGSDDSVAKLREKMGIDPAGLQQTIDKVNLYAAIVKDEGFQCGLVTDVSARVLKESDCAIECLYVVSNRLAAIVVSQYWWTIYTKDKYVGQRLTNKVAIVTGIGRAIAVILSEHGAFVIAVDMNLASDEASYITGTTLNVDGGRTAELSIGSASMED